MEIYIASFAGLLSTLLLAVVYVADRYEREPIELIQSYFLFGLSAQLVVILAVTAVVGDLSWSGPWLVITVVCAATLLPFQLHRQSEMDERFDGIVYSVAFLGGALCVIHINNLPRVIGASPYRDALASGAAPDVRDLLILAMSPEFSAELGRGVVVIGTAVLVGAVLGLLQFRGWSPWKTALVCAGVALIATGLDLVTGGVWQVRGGLAVISIVAALILKRRSVFKNTPEPPERDLLVLGLKTVLMIFGAALLATVLLQASATRSDSPQTSVSGPHADHQPLQLAGS